MREHDFIVSKTDTRGIITYGNRIFIEFSGYSEHELLGAQHNIIRHPDMPRGVFKLLWDTIAGGGEIFAYVKNLAKDGSFYWVFANVTPDYDEHGRICGYYSVRRCPKRAAVDICADLYRQMLAEEQRAGPRDACAASIALLQSVLNQKGISYEQLVLSL
ncbi:PAS domain S-box-containing protein [Paludibacterium purpuratum]|uniref:PAS domain S-box-containing protein n=2 Tax=Paludibacterium purpuratum TaxID=1144873 RepID=A0A4R7AYZ1_9NEIS|nr:PAS domain S-box-containing protein [Paludibacterium purpuratum]